MRRSDRDIAETIELSRTALLDVDADGLPVGFAMLSADPELVARVTDGTIDATFAAVVRSLAA